MGQLLRTVESATLLQEASTAAEDSTHLGFPMAQPEVSLLQMATLHPLLWEP